MNIELEIKDWFSSDINEIWNWVPKNNSDLYFTLDIEIGEVGKSEGSIFQIVIATPEGIRCNSNIRNNILSDRNLLILRNYDWDSVQKHLRKIVKSCSATTYEQSMLKLQRYFLWEYEDVVVEAGARPVPRHSEELDDSAE